MQGRPRRRLLNRVQMSTKATMLVAQSEQWLFLGNRPVGRIFVSSDLSHPFRQTLILDNRAAISGAVISSHAGHVVNVTLLF